VGFNCCREPSTTWLSKRFQLPAIRAVPWQRRHPCCLQVGLSALQLLPAVVNRPLNRCQELKRGSKLIFFFDKKPLQEDTPFWVSPIVQFCVKAFHPSGPPATWSNRFASHEGISVDLE
jgi:hypothetical protein